MFVERGSRKGEIGLAGAKSVQRSNSRKTAFQRSFFLGARIVRGAGESAHWARGAAEDYADIERILCDDGIGEGYSISMIN